jgi:hypothetical protein
MFNIFISQTNPFLQDNFYCDINNQFHCYDNLIRFHVYFYKDMQAILFKNDLLAVVWPKKMCADMEFGKFFSNKLFSK